MIAELSIALLREKDAEIKRLKAWDGYIKAESSALVAKPFVGKAISEFLVKAIERSRELGDLKPFVTMEDLYEIAKEMKEETYGRQSDSND